MSRHTVIGPDDPQYKNVVWRLIVTWSKTLIGYALMGLLIWAAMFFFGARMHFQLGFSVLYLILPIVSWWFSADISLWLMKCRPADDNNPVERKLKEIVHNLWLKTGLKYEPPVYISDNPSPNAFATGPIHRKAVVAATRGLFDCGMTDEELEAIFAHELGHVKNYDVGINSLLAILSSIFMIVVEAGWRGITGLQRLLGLDEKKNFGGIAATIVSYLIFWLCSQLTRLIQLFVVRSRESAADATGALFTGNPCALATALQKLVKYVQDHPPAGRERELFRSVRSLMTIDPLFDSLTAEEEPTTLLGKLKQIWRYLQLTHPPVPERIEALEFMHGGSCPRV